MARDVRSRVVAASLDAGCRVSLHDAPTLSRALGGVLAARTLAKSLSLLFALRGARPWRPALDAPLAEVLAARRELAAAVGTALERGRRASRRSIEPCVTAYEEAVGRLERAVGPGTEDRFLIRTFRSPRRR